MINLCEFVGGRFLSFLQQTGIFSIFMIRALNGILFPKIYIRNLLRQLKEIGFDSLPVIGMTAFFSGAVLALQSYVGFSRFSAESSIAVVVVLSITRELGPVLTGLMLSGRVAASIAAEIGTMRVTEQIDALSTLSTDPIKYLVTPRILAGMITLPILVLISDVIGVMGGYLVSVYKLHFNPALYLISTIKHLKAIDIISGLFKALVFGFIVTIIGCYSGYNANKGAKGVGKATTFAVVSSSILILLFNYIITELFFK